MKPKPFTYESWLKMLTICNLKGFQAHGDWRKRQFTKNGIVYDLSAADLEMLDYIEAHGSFIV